MKQILHLVPVNVLRKLHLTLIYSRLTYAITEWGSSFISTTRPIESLISRAITFITDQLNTDQFEMCPKFIKLIGVYGYYALREICRMICERKHQHFTLKAYNQLIAHEHGTRSRVNNKLMFPPFTKSRFQNALMFRGVKSWNTTPNNIKQSGFLARAKKYFQRFILKSSVNPDWQFQMVLIHSANKIGHYKI